MTLESLKYINSWLSGLGIPYAFMQWKDAVPDTYFIGEYQEVESMNEDGMTESDFIIMGNTNTNFYDLEKVKQKLSEADHTVILPNGNGLAVMYSNSYPVPSVEQGVYRIQITLKIKEWKV